MRLSLLCAVSALLMAACASPDSAPEPARGNAAETRVGSTSKPAGEWRLRGRAMAAAADRRAVEAALAAMNAGGSAVDAAIAAHAVLGLVEPQSSGLGGGGYMVVYDRASNATTVYDARETAPAAATPGLFNWDGKLLGFGPAIFSGKSVGAPSTVALYKAVHDKHGKLPWGRDFEAAIKLADEGFVVSPRLSQSLASARFQNGPLGKTPSSGAYFYPDGKPLPAGYLRKNADYANVLRAVSTEGPSAFYSGRIAGDIIAAVKGGDVPGDLSLKDLADYRVRVVPALCGPFKDYRICSAPPSSSGGVAMNLIMGLYGEIVAQPGADTDETRLRDFVLANQLAYADRDHYVADPEQVTVPVADLLDPAYIRSRAASGFRPGDKPAPGDPGAVVRGKPVVGMWGQDATSPQPGTTHLSFVDFEGNAVSFTATIESGFGSSRWTNGFLLNNQLTDFSLAPTLNGLPVANAAGPGKRPRSSMSPTIVFDKNGEVFMVTGSPGGNSVVGYVAKTLVAVLDWGKTAQEAASLPNVVARGQTVRVETVDATGKAWARTLTEAGFKVQEVSGEASGLHIIVARDKMLEGGADPRREGIAMESIR
ncbi:MAG: gamma-glutamyltransferase family protein [Alphaproteobacteria bacterium]|nr:gamma-glutamyltransferase family protein [Alphaproteobacteria bacterium]